MEIVRYEPVYKKVWDSFNATAKNGLFLFSRDYMEYHQDRFEDWSVLLFQHGILVAICPLNIKNNICFSHTGLTFGGLIISDRVKIHTYLQLFDLLLNHLRLQKVKKLFYKPIPFIFHQKLALEDQFALYRHNAILQNRSLSSCLEFNREIKYSKGRRWALKRAQCSSAVVKESTDFKVFMDFVKNTLNSKYGVNPVHTAAEITYLASHFPENIKLIAVYQHGEMLGGSIIYIHAEVVHLQYIGLSEQGKKLNALDLIVYYLIQVYKDKKKYINFGISPGNDQFDLNTGLIQNKESYGARCLPHDIYEITL